MGEMNPQEQSIDEKLTLAAQRVRAKAKNTPTPIAQIIAGSHMTPRIRAILEDPSFALERTSTHDVAPVIERAHARRFEALVPPRFRDASFASYSPMTDEQVGALAYVRAWAEDARDGRAPMLALIGLQGCGKSHLLYSAMRFLTAAGVSAYARPWYLLADELRYGGENPFTKARESALEIRERLYDQKIMMIDEVRATAATEFDSNELAKYSCYAYDARVAVLLTTNTDPLDLATGGPAAGRYTQVAVVGPDYRHLPAEA